MKKPVAVVAALVLVVGGVAFGYRAYVSSQLRSLVLAKLSDPDSALFRNESLFGWQLKTAVLCGEVNAKNRMGGYVGYRPFRVIAPSDVEIGEGDKFDEILTDGCKSLAKN